MEDYNSNIILSYLSLYPIKLKLLGTQAMAGGALAEIRVAAGLKLSRCAFSVNVGRLQDIQAFENLY